MTRRHGGQRFGRASRSTALLHLSHRLPEHILERESLLDGPIERPTLRDLMHQSRVTRHIKGLLETYVLLDIDEHCGRLPVLRHHDLLLTLLHAGDSLSRLREKLSLHSNPAVFLRMALTHEPLTGCSKMPSSKAAASEEAKREAYASVR